MPGTSLAMGRFLRLTMPDVIMAQNVTDSDEGKRDLDNISRPTHGPRIHKERACSQVTCFTKS